MLELADETSKANKFLRAAGIEAFTFQEKLEGLRDAGMDATQATEMFGLRATTIAQVLSANTRSVEELTVAYENADGAASKMAKTMLDNLHGATIKLKSAQEGLALALGEVYAPGKRAVIEAQTNLIREQSQAVKDGLVPLADVANAWQRIQIWWARAQLQHVKTMRESKRQEKEFQANLPAGKLGKLAGPKRLTLGEEAEVEKRGAILFEKLGTEAENAAGRVDRLRAAMNRQVESTKELERLRSKGGIDPETGEIGKAEKEAKKKSPRIETMSKIAQAQSQMQKQFIEQAIANMEDETARETAEIHLESKKNWTHTFMAPRCIA